MADSKRLRILKAITSVLQGVTPVNGFQHDLSGAVYRGRLIFAEDTLLPAVSLLETLNPDRDMATVGGNVKRRQKDKWHLLVQGWCLDDIHNPTDPAHNLMADVKKRLSRILDDSTADYLLGGLIEEAELEPGVVRPPDETSSRAFFYLRLVVHVVEKLDDPYEL